MRRQDKLKAIEKANLLAEQRYLESKSGINEIGPKLASKTLGYVQDPRKTQLQKDAINSMFSEFIGREDKPFYIQTRESANPVKYTLVEVHMNNRLEFVYFDFINDDGEDTDAPYAANKKHIQYQYDIEKDEFINESRGYFLNRFTVNFFVKAANLIRETYYTALPYKAEMQVPTRNGGYEYIQDPKFKMQSKVRKDTFRQSNFDSKNLMNNYNKENY